MKLISMAAATTFQQIARRPNLFLEKSYQQSRLRMCRKNGLIDLLLDLEIIFIVSNNINVRMSIASAFV